MFSANLVTDDAESPSRSRANRTKASASVTDTRLCNRSLCSSHCACSASFLRLMATMGVASASATYTQIWPWFSHEAHVGRTPSHLQTHQHRQLIQESRHILGFPSTASVTLDYLSVYIPNARDDGVELTGDGYLRTPSVLRG
jgi:hypothetical protein